MKNNIELATALANLCRDVPNLWHTFHRSSSPSSSCSTWDLGRREPASSPACSDHCFSRQDLLLEVILSCPLAGSSSDFLSIRKVPVALSSPLRSIDQYCQGPSLPTSLLPGPLEHSRLGVCSFVACWLTAVCFSISCVASLIHVRVNVLSRHEVCKCNCALIYVPQ